MSADLGRKARYTLMLQCAFSVCFEPDSAGTNFNKLILSAPLRNEICQDPLTYCSTEAVLGLIRHSHHIYSNDSLLNCESWRHVLKSSSFHRPQNKSSVCTVSTKCFTAYSSFFFYRCRHSLDFKELVKTVIFG